jgi:hypothetical protein
MRTLNGRLRPRDDIYGDVLILTDENIRDTASKRYRRSQGVLKMLGLPNTRDHSTCKHNQRTIIMPKPATTKVGSRNRERSAHIVELMFSWDELLDEEGEYFAPMTKLGLTLEEGEDYQILDSDGNTASLKSGPEKLRRVIVCELATRLNVPTSVKVPENGSHISASDRDWVSFRPRINTPFASVEARDEYIEKNDGETVIVTDSEEVEAVDNEEAN